ncbi:MurR/RpiR family transcriptional regulator [Desulfovermiculus halophilus]|jgi:DNA-binding MurR/RpiR family transcriptional regulator|uniref:MurR/RpiR family transcriptional regulator n=1 Tax=Desulfovermiculus halophilus TaxID=339722 RepID=UPI0004856AAF|nr:MurR/RpiR family transcriptional regulator [Desulfovermiculus halophilus]
MGTLSTILAERFPGLTPSQRKIARHILHHANDVLVSTQAQLAAQVGTSEATVSRFIHFLGFSRFNAFKDALAREAFTDFSTTRRLADSPDRLQGSVLSTVLSTDMDNIREISSSLTEETFQEAVRAITQANTVYILGLRSSYALAFYLFFTLRFFSSTSRLLKPDVCDLPEQAIGAGPDDVLISISFRRYTQTTIDLTGKLKSKGTKVVGLTDSMLSPLAHLADTPLIVSTAVPSFFESYTAAMSLINALLAAVALQTGNSALHALEQMESAFEDFDTYSRDEAL